MSLLLSILIFFQPNWDTDPNLWGIGVINQTQTLDTHPSNFNLPPNEAIAFYDAPNGNLAGYILNQLPPTDDLSDQVYVLGLFEERQKLDPKDSRETDYEIRSLLVFERRGNWVKVLHHSLQGAQWLNLKELDSCSLSYTDWIDYLVKTPTDYHPPTDFGLNLRSGPGANYDLLLTMKGDRFQIELTGKTKHGQWTEVKVAEFTDHPCLEGEPIGEPVIAWLKAIDDQGYPNIWYYTRGC